MRCLCADFGFDGDGALSVVAQRNRGGFLSDKVITTLSNVVILLSFFQSGGF